MIISVCVYCDEPTNSTFINKFWTILNIFTGAWFDDKDEQFAVQEVQWNLSITTT